MKRFLITILLIYFTATPANTMEIAGKNLPDTFNAAKENLILNGAGIRKKAFLKVYAAGLYLKAKNNNASQIVLADEPMAIRLHIISGLVTSENMEKSTREGFTNSLKALGKNVSGPVDTGIDNFISIFKEDIKKDDTYDLVYVPAVGVQAYKNGKFKTTVTGLDFKKALFGIWLSEKPVKEDLKKGMLGL